MIFLHLVFELKTLWFWLIYFEIEWGCMLSKNNFVKFGSGSGSIKYVLSSPYIFCCLSTKIIFVVLRFKAIFCRICIGFQYHFESHFNVCSVGGNYFTLFGPVCCLNENCCRVSVGFGADGNNFAVHGSD